jgi:hypothetical protein
MNEQELDQLQKDLKLLLSFAPAQSPTEVEPGLGGMFYITLSYEGDVKIAERVEEIRNRYNIAVEDVDDEELDELESDFD